MILPVGVSGCEIWTLTLKKENRMRMSEERELRRILQQQRKCNRDIEKNCII
jgi:hypothetical protein